MSWYIYDACALSENYMQFNGHNMSLCVNNTPSMSIVCEGCI